MLIHGELYRKRRAGMNVYNALERGSSTRERVGTRRPSVLVLSTTKIDSTLIATQDSVVPFCWCLQD